MTPTALAPKLLALADDELLLGHRNSEWCGHAPILEEDIAFANIAQDEIGHAILWYEALQAITGEEPDRQVYFRPATDWRNAQLVELPVGDWAFTMLRQYLFDAYELAWLGRLGQSAYAPLADVVRVVRPEELYHHRHSSNWVKRLGLGTDESHRRMQSALERLWPYALQLFVPLDGEAALAKAGLLPALSDVQADWEATTQPWLADSGLQPPVLAEPSVRHREQHSEHLALLLAEMQAVARTEPAQTEW